MEHYSWMCRSVNKNYNDWATVNSKISNFQENLMLKIRRGKILDSRDFPQKNLKPKIPKKTKKKEPKICEKNFGKSYFVKKNSGAKIKKKKKKRFWSQKF